TPQHDAIEPALVALTHGLLVRAEYRQAQGRLSPSQLRLPQVDRSGTGDLVGMVEVPRIAQCSTVQGELDDAVVGSLRHVDENLILAVRRDRHLQVYPLAPALRTNPELGIVTPPMRRARPERLEIHEKAAAPGKYLQALPLDRVGNPVRYELSRVIA